MSRKSIKNNKVGNKDNWFRERLREKLRDDKRKLAIQLIGDTIKNPLKNDNFQELTAGEEIIYDHLIDITPGKGNCPRVADRNGTTYRQFMSSSNGNCFVQESPNKNNEVQFNNDILIRELHLKLDRFFSDNRPDEFTFMVNVNKIKNLSGTARSRAQASTKCSARDVYEANHAILQIHDEFHLAHRQAHMFGGSENINNLDAGTAASNFMTLIMVELPLKNMLLSASNQAQASVHGKVTYLPNNPSITQSIQYSITWGNGRKVTFTTDHCNRRYPTRSETRLATAIFSETRTPDQSFFRTRSRTLMDINPNHPTEQSQSKNTECVEKRLIM